MCYEEVGVQIRCVWLFRIGLARLRKIKEENESDLIGLSGAGHLFTREEV